MSESAAEEPMKCPFCAEEIRSEAVVCRFCHAVKAGDRWQMAPARALGTFTLRFAGAAFVLSAALEVASIGSAVPLFGALRGGVVAITYHIVYVALFGALGIGLWGAKRWGYRVLLAGTCFYTIDNLRYVLDRAGMRAALDRQLGLFSGARDLLDFESLMQTTTLAAVLYVACWWGFVLYARRHRGYFAA